MTKPRVVLASASPIRFELLKNAGVDVERQATNFDERPLKEKARLEGWPAKRLALNLAEAKARTVPREDAFIIGADQVLEWSGRLLDKPISKDEAKVHLGLLSGQTHHLHSAVVVVRHGHVVFTHVEQVDMTMRSLSEEQIDHYLHCAGDQVLDTVGAYKLEALGAQLMTKVAGDYFSVLGLPLLPLLGFLRQNGIGQ